jgi:hypothetical protein
MRGEKVEIPNYTKTMNPRMNQVQAFTQETVEKVEMYEPKVLPVKSKGEVFLYDEDDYFPHEHDLVEKVPVSSVNGETRRRYVFISTIGGFQYLFKIVETSEDGSYYLSFKTIEYAFAITTLNETETKILFETIADLLETVYQDSEGKIITIPISPVLSSYSNEEIEECVLALLKGSKKFSEKELRENYKGYKVFDLYHETFKKPFHRSSYSDGPKAISRSRYFRLQFRKFLKNWRFEEPRNRYYFEFDLVRKGKEEK